MRRARIEEPTASLARCIILDSLTNSCATRVRADAPEAFPDLLDTLTELCTPGETEVLLTYPTRFTEGLFLEAATNEYGFELLGYEEEIEPSLWAARLRLLEEDE